MPFCSHKSLTMQVDIFLFVVCCTGSGNDRFCTSNNGSIHTLVELSLKICARLQFKLNLVEQIERIHHKQNVYCQNFDLEILEVYTSLQISSLYWMIQIT